MPIMAKVGHIYKEVVQIYDINGHEITSVYAQNGTKVYDGKYPIATLTGVDSISFKSDGSALTAWSISGNMVQNGTPSECGEISENLYDKLRTDGVTNGYFINKITRQETALSTYELSYPFPVTVGQTYRWTFNDDNGVKHTNPTVGFFDNANTMIGVALHADSVTSFTFTVPEGCAYIRASVYKATKNQAILTVGTEVIDYVPHWKIPIALVGQTQNVYLDEPLRKALDGSDAVDVLRSDGTLTRAVDSDGNALVTPTTENITVPTLTPTKGANTMMIDTTLSPSGVSITGRIKHIQT